MAAPASPLTMVLKGGVGTPLLVLMLLAMMVVPLPPLLLDALFTFNISLSLVVLLAVIYTKRPLEFGAFPTVLLLATLLRLALNVASTRVVLLHGHQGGDAAGEVIHAFGEFVIGGNTVVGVVVFAVLVIINFVVVTKGAGRVSEVSARFTLDAMPGKQMAIDADLSAGLIDQNEARRRRQEVAQEAEFYGAMDGASKFVRGDAVAGILVVFINIIGGIAIGALQHDMTIADAAHTFALLTIGDGLVAQIPSLVLSTGAAIMVTRVSASQDMGQEIMGQLFSSPKALGVTAGVMGTLGLVPGMPNLVFLGLALVAGAGAYGLSRKQRAVAVAPESTEVAPEPQARELSWDDVQAVDPVGLEVGYRLIPLVDRGQGGSLLGRIKGVRKKLSQDVGFLVPAVHIRDNLGLAPDAYRILLSGSTVAEGTIHTDRDLAINPGKVFGTVPGIATRDPAFGLEAVWIEASVRDQAQMHGYTVVDAATVTATHLSHVLQSHAHELLGYDDTRNLLDKLARQAPRLAEDLCPKLLPLAVIHRVLQNLLREGVPIRDIRLIAETLASAGAKSQDADVLTAVVRVALGRQIVAALGASGHELAAVTLDPSLEQILLQSAGREGQAAAVEPGLLDRIRGWLLDARQRFDTSGEPWAMVVTAAPLREWLARFVRQVVPGAMVLSITEIPDDQRLKIVGTIGR